MDCKIQGMKADRDKLQTMEEDNGFESPDRIAKFLTSLSFHDQAAEELTKDLEYYVANGKQRRADVWARRDDW
jgi:hypothetical protein